MASGKYDIKKKEMNIKLVIAVLLVLIILILSGGFLLYYILGGGPNGEQPPPQINETRPPEIIPDVPNVTLCDDQCQYEKAIQNSDETECKNISNISMQQQCYEELSDISLNACLKLENDLKKRSCIIAFAIADENLSLCDSLDEGIEDCKDVVDPCRKAIDVNLCYAIKDADPLRCQSDTDCILNYSTTTRDEEACNLIQNPIVSKGCLSAVTGQDKCHGFDKQSERDNCHLIYALYADEFWTCTQIKDNTVYALECYSTFAARMNDLSICERDGFWLDTKWKCYTNYSLISGDLEGCREIDELATTNRFFCAFEYAKKYGNPTACNIISSIGQRHTCYQGAIIYSSENLDWTYCSEVRSFEWRNKCFNEAAKLFDDVSLCDNIEEDFAKEACVIAYEIYSREK